MTATCSDTRLPDVHAQSATQLREMQAKAARAAGVAAHFSDPLSDGGQGPELAVIPAGSFEMGTPAGDRGFGDAPCHVKRVERAFAIGRHCVTASDFEVFARDSGYVFAEHLVCSEGRQPVINIDRASALAYLAWLSARTGQRYRLPSEAEWEYAARAGTRTRYFFGDELGCSEANTGSYALSGRGSLGWRRFLPFCAPMNQVVDTGLYPPNLWGLFDMHGNVWEFTDDVWVGPVAQHHVTSSHTGKWYVTKGGSWFEPAWEARSAARKPRLWDELDVNLGLRILRELENAG